MKTKNTLNLNGKSYMLENDSLYICHSGEWLKVKEDNYFLRNLSADEKILGIEGKVFSVADGKFNPIDLELLHQDSTLSYYISLQYGNEDNMHLVIMTNSENGNTHLLGRTFDEIADKLWKIGNALYKVSTKGTLDYLQLCRDWEFVAERAEIWDGKKNASDLSIYKFRHQEWEKIKTFPFMSRAL